MILSNLRTKFIRNMSFKTQKQMHIHLTKINLGLFGWVRSWFGIWYHNNVNFSIVGFKRFHFLLFTQHMVYYYKDENWLKYRILLNLYCPGVMEEEEKAIAHCNQVMKTAIFDRRNIKLEIIDNLWTCLVS